MDKFQELESQLRLQFHLNHPTLDSCYTDGYTAASAELDESENPYELGSKEADFWSQGWWAGFYQEPTLFDDAPSEITCYSSLAKEQAAKIHYAANQANWSNPSMKTWAGRVVKIAGAIAVTVAAIELMDIAV